MTRDARRPSRSSPSRVPGAPRTTAWRSATSCSSAATASSSWWTSRSRASWSERGFEERVIRMAPPEERRRSHGGPLGGVHPRDRARVPQAHDRADRDGDEAHLGGARGGRAVLARARDGDLGRRRAPTSCAPTTSPGTRPWSSRARRGCASSRRTRWRCATPTCRRCCRGSRWTTERVGGLPRRVPPSARGPAARAQRLPRVGGRGALPAGRVQHQLALVQPLPVPGGRRLPARRSRSTPPGTG